MVVVVVGNGGARCPKVCHFEGVIRVSFFLLLLFSVMTFLNKFLYILSILSIPMYTVLVFLL